MKRSWQISHFCSSVMTNPLKIFLHSHLLCGKFVENIVNTPSLTKATHELATNQFIILRHFILAACRLGRIFFKAWILSLTVIGICLALSFHHWNYKDLKVSPTLEDIVALIQSPWELLKGSSWNCSFGLHCDTPLVLSIHATQGPGTGAESCLQSPNLTHAGLWDFTGYI